MSGLKFSFKIWIWRYFKSRWVLRKTAKNSFRHNILWLRGCPDCSNEFGGLYFNDAFAADQNMPLATGTDTITIV